MKPEFKQRLVSQGGKKVPRTTLIPTLEMLENGISGVVAGERLSLGGLRERLAERFGAEQTCPITTQQLMREVAERSVSAHQRGQTAVPYWRVVDPERPNTKRLTGGAEFVRARLAEENCRDVTAQNGGD